MSSELFFKTIGELRGLLASKAVSSTELVQAVVARTKAVDDRIKAFNSFDEAGALAAATCTTSLGPPMSVKVGLCAGQFTVPADFDRPLPDDILGEFEGP